LSDSRKARVVVLVITPPKAMGLPLPTKQQVPNRRRKKNKKYAPRLCYRCNEPVKFQLEMKGQDPHYCYDCLIARGHISSTYRLPREPKMTEDAQDDSVAEDCVVFVEDETTM
jgi:hypothetical protein